MIMRFIKTILLILWIGFWQLVKVIPFYLEKWDAEEEQKQHRNNLSFHVGTHVGRMLGACGDGSGAHESGGGKDEKKKSENE